MCSKPLQTSPEYKKNNILRHFTTVSVRVKRYLSILTVISHEFSGFGSPDSLGKDFKGFEKPRLAQIEIWKEFGRNLMDFR